MFWSGNGLKATVRQINVINQLLYCLLLGTPNFSKFCGPVCQILQLTVANLPHIVIPVWCKFATVCCGIWQTGHRKLNNLIFCGLWTRPNMQYLSPVTATDRYSLSTKLTGNISDQLSLIFSVFLVYFMVKSCMHTVRWTELHQDMPYLSLITVQYRIPQNFVKT